MKHILTFKNDLAKYPPIISVIETLLKSNNEVIYYGFCSDTEIINRFLNSNFFYHEVIFDNTEANNIIKLLKFITYKRRITAELEKFNPKDIRIWIFGNQNLWLLKSLIYKYKTIVYLFELPEFRVPLSYRLFCSNKNYQLSLQSAEKVVCCEYCRGAITHSYFKLKKFPYIIPNKPVLTYEDSNIDIKKIQNKKIILYQGIFIYPERRLEEFCQAMDFLSNEFVLVLMGGPENEYRNMLKNKYESERILFLPFITPPKHLDITRQAYIGILSYYPNTKHLQGLLNVLFCAPNKIYEYSNFAIPMIANSLPSLKFCFERYNAGITFTDYNPQIIAQTILEIDSKYDSYKQGAMSLYKSIDINSLLLSVAND